MGERGSIAPFLAVTLGLLFVAGSMSQHLVFADNGSHDHKKIKNHHKEKQVHKEHHKHKHHEVNKDKKNDDKDDGSKTENVTSTTNSSNQQQQTPSSSQQDSNTYASWSSAEDFVAHTKNIDLRKVPESTSGLTLGQAINGPLGFHLVDLLRVFDLKGIHVSEFSDRQLIYLLEHYDELASAGK